MREFVNINIIDEAINELHKNKVIDALSLESLLVVRRAIYCACLEAIHNYQLHLSMEAEQ